MLYKGHHRATTEEQQNSPRPALLLGLISLIGYVAIHPSEKSEHLYTYACAVLWASNMIDICIYIYISAAPLYACTSAETLPDVVAQCDTRGRVPEDENMKPGNSLTDGRGK